MRIALRTARGGPHAQVAAGIRCRPASIWPSPDPTRSTQGQADAAGIYSYLLGLTLTRSASAGP